MYINENILGEEYRFTSSNSKNGNKVYSEGGFNDDSRVIVLQSCIKLIEIILIDNQENAMQTMIENVELSKLVSIMTEIYTNIIDHQQNQIIGNVK